MNLSERSIKLLSCLGKNPLGTNKELSKACGISPYLFKKHLRALYASKIVLGVSAQINRFAIGLMPVIATAEVNPDKLRKYERVLDIHPYTTYRMRCFGKDFNSFSIFEIPIHTTGLLRELFEWLSEKGLVSSSVLLFPSSKPFTTEIDFKYYDLEAEWSFDWKKWGLSILDLNVEPLDIVPDSVLYRLDEADMRILRQLSKDARRKKRDIAIESGVEPYHYSRRRKILEQLGVIEGYRIMAGMHLLQLASHVIISGHGSTEAMSRIASAVKLLPFQSYFFPTWNGFILYIITTALDLPVLLTSLRQYCDDIDVSLGDYRSTFRYWFYDLPFNDMKWQDDECLLTSLQKEIL